jgi:phosphoribosylformimino-5-aminoimidazole carboxamide ribotide isomerase
MIELIPAIDIIDGQCVRLTKGDYQQKTVYRDSPAEVAKEFEALGFKRLHVVDLDGAKSKHIVNSGVLSRITAETSLTVDFGGGIKTDEDIEKAFAAGAAMVTVGSIAVTQPDLFMGWLEKYGTDRMILGADVRHGKISINGWKEDSTEDLLPFLRKYIDAGVRNVLCTEISKDGTLAGPAIDLYKQVMDTYPELHLIASGGVSSIDDIIALDAAGIPAVVFGKAIYEGRIDLRELITLLNSSIPCQDWQNASSPAST